MGEVWAVKELGIKTEGVLDAMERGKLKWGGKSEEPQKQEINFYTSNLNWYRGR